MGNKVTLKTPGELYNRLSQMIVDTGFLNDKSNKLIVISDHGFCSFGKAKFQTLPPTSEWGDIKGDHHENALVITVNRDYEIERPQDMCCAISHSMGIG